MRHFNNSSSPQVGKTPKSMNQAFCWMPDGKCTKPDDRNWSIKPQKVKENAPVKIVYDVSKTSRQAHLALIRKQQIIENRKRIESLQIKNNQEQ